MLKTILKLQGAQELSKSEAKSINGGVTEECSRAISTGFALFKGGKPCPLDYYSLGGCCWPS
ncbi:hypothetical protein J3S90_06155 [Flavobacterium sp. P4023]|uniref:Bacteriocin-type signal sequence-containing protein n=1 Tax=Flavobacterium flabelliforme TaxID=2816119 RepID=A0ABS5CRZ0_9FLAO|nr:hypothetical protein [Flavobacterium flabelliforme]MBP4141382.1 hypothetical protein [Flavobacterium flabelliforme]